MKKLLCALAAAALLAGCTAAPAQTNPPPETASTGALEKEWGSSGHVLIQLDDQAPAVLLPEGAPEDAVTFANDIIYYEEGHDASYGEGGTGEAHSADEAAAHTVVHINAPGTYVLAGKLSAGQIAVDLGEDAREDPEAVVTLILDGVDITCSVAPAIIFYNVYECGDTEQPAAIVDTAAAGANVILTETSRNYITGSHVAKIYKPGTEKKLHKYDGAFYSKMSMNIGGQGFLHITADNEGLDSELHLTINGGKISIVSGNDGINTNEDGVSVTTINGGTLRIEVTGETGEGDGIDSNGWLVINGGSLFAYACGASMDAGIDSDMGIHIAGGTVCATGNMVDQISVNSQTYALFSFAQTQEPGAYLLKNDDAETVLEVAASNAFQNLFLTSPALTPGTYTLWSGDTQFEGCASQMGPGSFVGEIRPIERPDWPGPGDGEVQIPPQPTDPVVTQGTAAPPPQGDQPADMPVPDFSGDPEQMPSGPVPQGGGNMPVPNMPGEPGGQMFPVTGTTGEPTREFRLTQGANSFSFLKPAE